MNITIDTGTHEVNLTKPSGAGSIYHIMIGKMYHGQIVPVQAIPFDRDRNNLDEVKEGGTVWHAYLADKSEITFAELKLLLEAVEKAED